MKFVTTPVKIAQREACTRGRAHGPAMFPVLYCTLSTVVLVLYLAYSAEIPGKTAAILSSAALIILLKKNAAAMEEMKARLGPTYVQPQRPIGMGTAIVKMACNCALLLVKEAMDPAVGPT